MDSEKTVYVVYQNHNIVGVYSTKETAQGGVKEADIGMALQRDAFFEGKIEVSVQIFVLDRTYHPSKYKATTVKADQIKRNYTKKDKAPVAQGQGQAPKKRGRPKKEKETV